MGSRRSLSEGSAGHRCCGGREGVLVQRMAAECCWNVGPNLRRKDGSIWSRNASTGGQCRPDE